jgi:radical SAM superfamily enzyme YgiQ (UPF0313 family)
MIFIYTLYTDNSTNHMNTKDTARICLIIPPSPFLSDQRVFVSLGILKVAAVLRDNRIPVEVLDLSGYSNPLDIVRDYSLQNQSVSHFGITATTPQYPDVVRITEVLRGNSPSARIILGGPHITLVNAARRIEISQGRDARAKRAMEHAMSAFDILVAGDGEEAIFEALKPDAPKNIDADDSRSPLFLTNSKLTQSPWPARELVDLRSYNYTIDGEPATSLIAQLGCPFNCGFCGGRESPMLRRIRTRTSENVVAEMVHLYKTYGYKAFMMYDDELNVNKDMVGLMLMIVRAQRDLGVTWKLRGFIKSQLFTDEQAQAMYHAGFRWILVGFESGSEEILTAINKKATRAENTRCMNIAKRNGLKVKALMSMGHPGESPSTIAETRSWLLEAKPDDFDITVITCYPGTPYYDQAVEHSVPGEWVYTYKPTGAKLYQKEVDFATVSEFYKGDPNKGYQAYVYTDYLSSGQIVDYRNNLERELRRELNIPFSASVPALQFEHSMGQGLPSNILRTT